MLTAGPETWLVWVTQEYWQIFLLILAVALIAVCHESFVKDQHVTTTYTLTDADFALCAHPPAGIGLAIAGASLSSELSSRAMLEMSWRASVALAAIFFVVETCIVIVTSLKADTIAAYVLTALNVEIATEAKGLQWAAQFIHERDHPSVPLTREMRPLVHFLGIYSMDMEAGLPGPSAPLTATSTESYCAPLLGSEVVAPHVNTNARGLADLAFTQSDSTWTGDYNISIFNASNILSVEVHQAPRASIGDLVYYFYGPVENPSLPGVNGVFLAGTINPAQFKGPLHGKGVKDMRDRADDGDLYVLVVTAQNPNGELRGELVPTSISACYLPPAPAPALGPVPAKPAAAAQSQKVPPPVPAPKPAAAQSPVPEPVPAPKTAAPPSPAPVPAAAPKAAAAASPSPVPAAPPKLPPSPSPSAAAAASPSPKPAAPSPIPGPAASPAP
ncbi:hypothetical protein COCOBI_08-0920 [Coccomyxa sp. Obi]|nr:hypothetical protein COCOBI_08-0920 [Coccomyxa sp. Obi]